LMAPSKNDIVIKHIPLLTFPTTNHRDDQQ